MGKAPFAGHLRLHLPILPPVHEILDRRSRGGSNRVSNLTLACEPCNQKKGNHTAAEFGFPHLMAQANAPLRNAAAVNSVRWAVVFDAGLKNHLRRVRRGSYERRAVGAGCANKRPFVLYVRITPLSS